MRTETVAAERAGGKPKTLPAVDSGSLVDVRGVCVRYRNGALGVVDASLTVGAGELVCLFGANGAGKTTTVRAITGFLRSEGAAVTGGEVSLFGRRVNNWEPHRVSGLGVAFIPERKKVFPNLTVADNLAAIGTLPPRDRRRAAFERVYDLFPMLAGRQRELAGRLSGGQQQMVAIARGLLHEPRLLIIDELTLGLHVSLQRPLFETLAEVAREGTAVLVVDESTGCALDFADRCYVLHGGHIAADGDADDFRGEELVAAGYIGDGGSL